MGDLPDPSKLRKRYNQFEESQTVQPAADSGVPAQVPRYVPPPLVKPGGANPIATVFPKRPAEGAVPSDGLGQTAKASRPAPPPEPSRKRDAPEASTAAAAPKVVAPKAKAAVAD